MALVEELSIIFVVTGLISKVLLIYCSSFVVHRAQANSKLMNKLSNVD